MSCVYDCLIREFRLRNTDPEKLLKILKKRNRLTKNVEWNHEPLSDADMQANFERIQQIQDTDGYDCSSCDPVVLFLMAELYNKVVVHDFNGSVVTYRNINAKGGRIIIESDRHHMH